MTEGITTPRLTYKEYGVTHPEVIVFLHGGGVGGWIWDKQIEYFSRNYHCIVPELLYLNDAHAKEFSIDGTARAVIALIESIGKRGSITLVGFSLGAQVALSVLSMRPTLFSKAMINSALVKPIPFANILIKMITPTLFLTRHRAFSDIQAKSMYLAKDYLETYYQENKSVDRRAFARMMAENMTYTLPPALSQSTATILVTVGEKEASSVKKSAKEIVNANPHTRRMIVPRIGHGFPLASAKLFNKTLEGLMKADENK